MRAVAGPSLQPLPAPPGARGPGRGDLAVLGLLCLPATPGAAVSDGAAFLLPLPA